MMKSPFLVGSCGLPSQSLSYGMSLKQTICGHETLESMEQQMLFRDVSEKLILFFCQSKPFVEWKGSILTKHFVYQ